MNAPGLGGRKEVKAEIVFVEAQLAKAPPEWYEKGEHAKMPQVGTNPLACLKLSQEGGKERVRSNCQKKKN